MKAFINKGKRKGEEVVIGQWCNDWFSDHDSTAIFSPTMLTFTQEGMKEIYAHKNNGMLLKWFKAKEAKAVYMKEGDIYSLTFTKRKI